MPIGGGYTTPNVFAMANLAQAAGAASVAPQYAQIAAQERMQQRGFSQQAMMQKLAQQSETEARNNQQGFQKEMQQGQYQQQNAMFQAQVQAEKQQKQQMYERADDQEKRNLKRLDDYEYQVRSNENYTDRQKEMLIGQIQSERAGLHDKISSSPAFQKPPTAKEQLDQDTVVLQDGTMLARQPNGWDVLIDKSKQNEVTAQHQQVNNQHIAELEVKKTESKATVLKAQIDYRMALAKQVQSSMDSFREEWETQQKEQNEPAWNAKEQEKGAGNKDYTPKPYTPPPFPAGKYRAQAIAQAKEIMGEDPFAAQQDSATGGQTPPPSDSSSDGISPPAGGGVKRTPSMPRLKDGIDPAKAQEDWKIIQADAQYLDKQFGDDPNAQYSPEAKALRARFLKWQSENQHGMF